MTRLVAFTLFVCAAFAWIPPWLDRTGTALLAAGFLALALPRASRGMLARAREAILGTIAYPTADAGQLPPHMRAPMFPPDAAGVATASMLTRRDGEDLDGS